MSRLRVQLILAFTLVVLVAVGAIAFLVNRTTDTQFRQYITHSGMQASGTAIRRLVTYYQRHGSWDGVESLLAGGVFVTGLEGSPVMDMLHHAGGSGGELDITLADADGRIVYDSGGRPAGRKLKAGEQSQALSITGDSDGKTIGYLLLSLSGSLDRLGQLEQQFLMRMRRILIVGALLAVGAGLAFGAVISRSLTAPLQRLSTAARAVAAGHLDQKVKVEGSDEMVEMAQAFNDMTTALAKSERQRQNLVADVAHELRTPLTVLQGNLRAILDGVYPLEPTEISRLYDETRLLGRLVDDLRELALADAGQLRLNTRPVDLGQVVRFAVDNLGPAAEAEGVALSSQLPDDLPPVHADPDRLGQVLRNLLVNALRHTPAGGRVTVTARLRRAQSSQTAKNAIEVAVADTGEGITAKDLPHVFERFWRADPARVRHGGTGLGLSVAQSLVEAQGGQIWAESTPGQGSTFRFTLPLAAA